MNYRIRKGQNISRHCMVCGIDNRFGLKTRFHETEEREVVAVFTPRPEHQSYPGMVHGGISAALLDEVIGRAIMPHGDENSFGVTVDLNVRYRKVVPLGVELKAVGRVSQEKGRFFEGSGELYLPDGSVAVSAQGKYLRRNLSQITNDGFLAEQWFAPVAEIPDRISV
ncbi:MAG: PaaI family thioesterase [Spirochaetaceae bacterium]|nr:MAG: PaaI family thioesterase [Spirochaetaceae bacterium]